MNKLKIRCTSIFNYSFIFLFSIVFIGASTVLFANIYVVIFTMIISALILFGGYKLYKIKDTITPKKVNIYAGIMLSVMFLIQLFFGYNLQSTPVTDWGIVDTIAHNYAINGTFDHSVSNNGVSNVFAISKGKPVYYMSNDNLSYMARYSNNNGILIILSLFYRAIYLILGYIPSFSAVVLNTIFIFIAVLFTFLISKLIFKPLGSLITVTACFLFMPFYTYTPYYYSDSLSIPFVVISTYFIILGAKTTTEKLFKKILYFVIAGFSITVGYTIKGSLLVILIGGIVYLLLSKKLKHSILSCVSLILSFIIFSAVLGVWIQSLNISTPEERYEYQYPLNHWVMMGLNGNGGYNDNDSSYTKHAGNYDEKVKADNNMIKKRLKTMGISGLTEHLYNKIIYTWGDGTYWITKHLNTLDKNGNKKTNISPMFNFIRGDVFYVYSNVYHMIMLALIITSAIAEIKRKRISYMTMINGIIFGCVIFFMIWEARSRYIYNFTPLFIISATNGLLFLWENIKIKVSNKISS